MRPRFTWKLRRRSLTLGERTLVMAIVNVTPDSFSDGGTFFETDAAVDHALAMLRAGADILDVGGESTRPGAKTGQAGVSAEEELQRVIPVINGILRTAPDAVISIDTYKASVARAAVEAGAEIVNDVSALRWDADMTRACLELGCGVVLMHMRGRPDEWATLPPLENPVELVLRDLRTFARAAEAAGLRRDRIVLDPGFGFGKRLDENYPLLAQLDCLHSLGYPLLSATSRKAFIGHSAGRGTTLPPRARVYGTIATVTASILRGAHIVRVHDVQATVEAAAVADAILRAGEKAGR